jgi:hypothetical protein
MLRCSPILGIWVCLLLPAKLLALSKEEQELLERVRAGHRAAVQSIHSLTCRITEENVTPQGQFAMSADYRWSPEAIRIHSHLRFPDLVENVGDQLVRGGRRVSYVKQTYPDSTPARVGGVICADLGVSEDAWRISLMRFTSEPLTDDNRPPLSFDELLARPHQLRAVKRVNEGHGELVYIDLVHGKQRDELWFDPKVNYLVRKQVRHHNARKGKAEFEVMRFKEVAAGIYFPERVEMHATEGGQPHSSWVASFSEIHVNQPLPRDAFEFHFPAGITIVDSIQNKVFQVETDGRLVHRKDQQVVPLSQAKKASGHRTATRQEPKSSTWWLLPTSLLLLAMAAGGWLNRKRRQRAVSIS